KFVIGRPRLILYKEHRRDIPCSLPDRSAQNARPGLLPFQVGYPSLFLISWGAVDCVFNPGVGPRVATRGRILCLSGTRSVPPEAKSWQLGNARSAEGGTLS